MRVVCFTAAAAALTVEKVVSCQSLSLACLYHAVIRRLHFNTGPLRWQPHAEHAFRVAVLLNSFVTFIHANALGIELAPAMRRQIVRSVLDLVSFCRTVSLLSCLARLLTPEMRVTAVGISAQFSTA